jgi:hypothetical protein
VSVGFAAAPGFEEEGEGFVVLAVATGFVAVHEFEGAVLLVDAGEGDPGAGGGVGWEGCGILLFSVLAELVTNGGAFHAGETHLTPFGDGHGFDEGHFVGGVGGEGVFEVSYEFAENLAGFAFEEDGFGQHTVAKGVVTGYIPAFGRSGATGFGAVAAGGGLLGIGAGFEGGVWVVHLRFHFAAWVDGEFDFVTGLIFVCCELGEKDFCDSFFGGRWLGCCRCPGLAVGTRIRADKR